MPLPFENGRVETEKCDVTTKSYEYVWSRAVSPSISGMKGSLAVSTRLLPGRQTLRWSQDSVRASNSSGRMVRDTGRGLTCRRVLGMKFERFGMPRATLALLCFWIGQGRRVDEREEG